jgi:hypothetical protein
MNFKTKTTDENNKTITSSGIKYLLNIYRSGHMQRRTKCTFHGIYIVPYVLWFSR